MKAMNIATPVITLRSSANRLQKPNNIDPLTPRIVCAIRRLLIAKRAFQSRHFEYNRDRHEDEAALFAVELFTGLVIAALACRF
jgi:hypothetical protein